MSEIVVREQAVKRSGQALPPIEKDQAISFMIPFASVKHLLEGTPAPKRPNRNRPIHVEDPQLRAELEAWDAASDEAIGTVDDLPE